MRLEISKLLRSMTCSLIVKTIWFRVVNAAPRLLSTRGRPWHASRASLSVLSKLMLLAKPLKVGAAVPPRRLRLRADLLELSLESSIEEYEPANRDSRVD